MSSLLETLNQALGEDSVHDISRRIGAQPDQTRSAIQQALPVILGALGQEAADPQRAPGLQQALAEDHDGSVVDDPQAYLAGAMQQKATDGQAILDHVLGNRQEAAHQALSSKTGLDMSKIASLLPLLAPIVMSLLGKQQRNGGTGAGDLGSILSGETNRAAGASPDIGDLLGSILGSR
jgi:hypothetical protein